MGEGKRPFLILVLTCGAFLTSLPSSFAKDLKREATCYNDVLHVGCGKHSFIAVHSAYFTTEHTENQTCQSPTPEDEYIDDHMITEPTNHTVCKEDIRVFVNRKCSGLKNCNYSYNQETERTCSSPEGVFIVQYDCVRESNANRYCNSRTSPPEGYIASPGFPHYYPTLRECNWLLSAAEGQTVLLKVLDLHLRPAAEIVPTPADPFYVLGRPAPEPLRRCDDDSLSLVQGVTKRFSVCGEGKKELREERADGGEALELRFKSVGFLPASGFLVYYKVMGCPSVALSDGSYLVEKNGTSAQYACKGDRHFNDTLQRTRFFQCVRDHHWNDTLPPCVEPPAETSSTTIFDNLTTEYEMQTNESTQLNSIWNIIKFPRDAGFVEDILIPCILIGVLIFGNIIILIIICVLRKRQKPTIEDEDNVLEEVEPPEPLVTEADV